MKKVDIFLPKLGESIVRGTIISWFKKVGDSINLDEPLLEVATDKVNSEIPSPVSGVLKQIFFEEGETVEVGALIAIIQSGNEEKIEKRESIKKTDDNKENKSFQKFLSPVAKKLMEKHGLSVTDVEGIERTGAGGRLSRRDIQRYLENRGSVNKVVEKDSKVEMTPIRKQIANKMEEALKVPMGSLVMKVDVTHLLDFIDSKKEEFIKKEGVKLTITSFIAQQIAKAAAKFPYVNSKFEKNSIILKKNINLGIAIDIENGLVVPNIKNCDKKDISQIVKEIFNLAKAARSNSLKPLDIQDGTITMTNFGMGGALIGIPIIKCPEVVIVGIGAIEKQVMPSNGGFLTKKILMMSLSFDHRVIDGMYGCNFLKQIKKGLEDVEKPF